MLLYDRVDDLGVCELLTMPLRVTGQGLFEGLAFDVSTARAEGWDTYCGFDLATASVYFSTDRLRGDFGHVGRFRLVQAS